MWSMMDYVNIEFRIAQKYPDRKTIAVTNKSHEQHDCSCSIFFQTVNIFYSDLTFHMQHQQEDLHADMRAGRCMRSYFKMRMTEPYNQHTGRFEQKQQVC